MRESSLDVIGWIDREDHFQTINRKRDITNNTTPISTQS